MSTGSPLRSLAAGVLLILGALPSAAQEATLAVSKDVSPVKDLTAFPFTIEGSEVLLPFELMAEEAQHFTLDPGIYIVREDVPEDWELTFIRCGTLFEAGPVASGALRLELEAGDSVLCRFSNTMLGVPPPHPPSPPGAAVPTLSPLAVSILMIAISVGGAFLLTHR